MGVVQPGGDGGGGSGCRGAEGRVRVRVRDRVRVSSDPILSKPKPKPHPHPNPSSDPSLILTLTCGGAEGGGAATTMVGTDSTVMPSAAEAAVAFGRAAESVACTSLEVVEAGTAMVAVMSTEAALMVTLIAEGGMPASRLEMATWRGPVSS